MPGSKLPQRLQLYNKQVGKSKKERGISRRTRQEVITGQKHKKKVANTSSIWYYTFCD